MPTQNRQDTNIAIMKNRQIPSIWDQIIEVIKLNKKRLNPNLPYGAVTLSVRKGRVYKIEVVSSLLVHTTEEAQKQEDKNHDDKTLST